ncbi:MULTISPECIES: class I SAM-dependent methyltransferase [Rhizobium]|uniref:Class I SAM-dependent methyltransferase n=1 Tax=Rhizobium tropici TaxID=398 RepID=A0A6P1CGY0_RHITR|nr:MULTISPECIES: class I SAM-dependent methyltransferase [Rhizobium]AGB74961.1 hypothetical protein RTCIAT899_PC05845 [Rhizobium tropici CIAT 899]MBB4245585.1 hypothetical protein [Rhizobium tropici]MBB5596864.1 hypothetical protein [Rhizobium tropici]MBB6495914.1 hypothetical protein [Rhizobium tropici]NEV15372.1 class I SAM-dependent methyltransferase [Rhizobium tropici]
MAEKLNIAEKISQRYWNLRSFSMPEELSRVPTMLTVEETRMLAWVSENWSSGIGAVIDLGSFLGGSTAHLAYGLNRSQPGRIVHAFDQFTIGDEWKQAFLYDRGYPELIGNDMLALFKQFVEKFGDVVTHRGQIEDAEWTEGPIEILFVDICKSWEATRHVMRQFYPSLLPNESLVIHQDFQHFQQPWVVATTQYLKDYLRLVSYTEENSAIFLCTRSLSPEIVERAIYNTRDIQVVFRLLQQAHDQFPYARQREAMWQHIVALERHPNAQNTWDLNI